MNNIQRSNAKTVKRNIRKNSPDIIFFHEDSELNDSPVSCLLSQIYIQTKSYIETQMTQKLHFPTEVNQLCYLYYPSQKGTLLVRNEFQMWSLWVCVVKLYPCFVTRISFSNAFIHDFAMLYLC